jgi:dolichol-phosphate mannosyltransferase
MSASPIQLSVVMPAYLEEENLRLLLPRLAHVLRSMQVPSEIVVVDTETPLDATEQACEELGARYVRRRGGNLYGDAVRTGIQEAQGEFCIFMDADGSHTPEFIPELFAKSAEADVVIASRYIAGGYTENPAVLIWMSRILNITYSIVLGLRCKDVSNSFKLYRSRMLKPLILRCDHFDIIEEILFKLHRFNRGLRISEVPFSFKKRMFGQTKRNLLLFMAGYLYTIVRLRLSTFWPSVRGQEAGQR